MSSDDTEQHDWVCINCQRFNCPDRKECRICKTIKQGGHLPRSQFRKQQTRDLSWRVAQNCNSSNQARNGDDAEGHLPRSQFRRQQTRDLSWRVSQNCNFSNQAGNGDDAGGHLPRSQFRRQHTRDLSWRVSQNCNSSNQAGNGDDDCEPTAKVISVRSKEQNAKWKRKPLAINKKIEEEDFATDTAWEVSKTTHKLSSTGNLCRNGLNSGEALIEMKKLDRSIGFKGLKKLLDSHPEQIVLQLLMADFGYDLMFEVPESITMEQMSLLIQVLARATETVVHKESLRTVFIKTFQAKFVNYLIRATLTNSMKTEQCEKLEFFDSLSIILHKFAHEMPRLAVDQICELIASCIICLQQSDDDKRLDLIEKYESTKSFLENAKMRWKSCQRSIAEDNHRAWFLSNIEPPNNFREISLIPTTEELNDPVRPFVRRNIVCGKYVDVEHYLDVQFRLLREDFVRPLREGIQEVKGNGKNHKRDISIYKNVKISGTDIKNFNMIHNIQLETRGLNKILHSKKLMHGNLVCLSHDNFKTVIFGSIFEREKEKLREGILSVKFESDVDAFSKTFVMVESKAYFIAYEHVLKALQRITVDTFPMEDFIVYADSDMPLPMYLKKTTTYDLRVLRSKNMMKTSEIHHALLPQTKVPVSNDHAWLTLDNVLITRELEYWPSCIGLGLDDSQRRALRSALTSKLSIIQGPPGTGKTFLGLKIAQVLLHNSDYWRDGERKSPMLIVCYTNHALDQFLEGMLPYTNSIVRVGNRSQSELLKDFQINTLLKDLHFSIPAEVYQMAKDNRIKLIDLEEQVRTLRRTLHELRVPLGIVNLESLTDMNVIPDGVIQQFRFHDITLKGFLMCPAIFHGNEQMDSTKPPKTRAPLRNADQYFTEENERKLDKEDLVVDIGTYITRRNGLSYEVKQSVLEEEICVRSAMEKLKRDILLLMETSDSEKREKFKNVQNEILELMRKPGMEKLERDFFTIMETSDPEIREEFEKIRKWMRKRRFSRHIIYILCDSENKRSLLSLKEDHAMLKYGLGIKLDKGKTHTAEKCDITFLTFEQRWSLYKFWLQILAEKVEKILAKTEKELLKKEVEHKGIKEMKNFHIMRHASVIGMTTTGAANHRNILQALQPKIVIVEEAAEILEAHVVTSLTHECQHLIMIGDHKQLQPSATVYELGTKYGLETSLFERLIKNGIAYETLEYQHRMRPSISRLLVPSIYPHLKDHESVHKHPHIRGMEKDVFFITHNHYENLGGEESHSKANTFEAELIMALCRHLMLQGYSNKDVTVLTPYSGQYFLLKEVRLRYEECTDVRISIVDNFQGEESNIILLSLVRSNEEGKVGFLRKENRVCVALSRAKHGLYIAGNMDQLKESSDLWGDIHEDLVANECIGGSVGLQCENHPEVSNHAKTADDILYMSPEGGCRAFCTADLPKCGHKCPKRCHVIDPDHDNVKCPHPCPKSCERNHKCQKKCWEKCDSCKVLVAKSFPCGHINKVYCCKYDLEQPCKTMVTKILPVCQHEATMNCCENAITFPCPKPCEIRLPCGHKCARNCHLEDDPDHFEYQCKEPCPRSPEGCSAKHECKKRCYEECGSCTIPKEKNVMCGHRHKVLCSTRIEDIECNMQCKRQLSCGHFCPRKCKDKCGGCSVMVKKIIQDCQHETEVECSKPALKSDCNSQCNLILPCGHKCQALCRESCTSECKVRVPSERHCPHGHQIKLPCYLVNKVSEEIAWIFCSTLCGTTLDCGHLCKGKCGQCLNGRMHVACGEKCERPLVCGHICKADCSKACPPCQEMCPVRCQHSHCGKKCGEPCSPCQEKCQRSCQHHKCNKPCREKCAQQLCEKACRKKLKCGHPCVGFCGDPCPPLCRVCHKEELTEIFFGSEDEPNARFVLLDDCGHVFEANGLQEWLSQEDEEIGMKSCPRCKLPINNNRRYHEFIVKAYANVRSVQKKYYNLTTNQLEEDIKNIQQDLKTLTRFASEVQQISKCLPKSALTYTQKVYNSISDNEITLWKFQVKVLKKITSILMENNTYSTDLMPHVNIVKKRLMEQRLQISPQMTEEITCELQRISFLSSYWTLLRKLKVNEDEEARKIEKDLKQLMDPIVKFDENREEQVKQKLKESEKYVGSLGITDQERLEIVKAMGLKQGHWYKCPRGHIYCITECGGAMEETNCPNCDAKIGGSRHTLRSDNAVATEMDGARHSAWSQHYNNMENFHLDD